MVLSLNSEELLRLRMTAQGLVDADSGTAGVANSPADVSAAQRIAHTARHMLAMQGQDWRSVRWALGLRAPGTTVEDVHAAFDEGLIVRSWPMRGTLHVVAAEDIGWMQRATNERVLAGAAKRRAFLGLTDDVLDRLVEVSLAAISQGAGLTRDELATAWTEAGLEWKSNWRYHLIWWLCQNGLAVFGPVRGGSEPLLVDASHWIRHQNAFDGDEALAELAARYATARGAVTARDLAWWSGFTAGQAKRALALAVEADRLAVAEVAGSEKKTVLWAAPAMLERMAESSHPRGWQLLPSFDEHLLGYQDREPQLLSDHLERIIPGKNGMFLATIVREGRVVGTWKRGTRKAEGLIGTALPGEAVGSGLPDLTAEAADWSAFHGLDALPFSLAAP